MDLQKLLFINELTFLSVKEKNLLAESSFSFSDLLKISLDDICIFVKRPIKSKIFNPIKISESVKKALYIIEKFNIKSVAFNDEDFPPLLREMSDPPFMIFYRGNLKILRKKCVSVVGTRKATFNGLKCAQDFSKSACDSDFTVVSGLAFGIDNAAHKGALLSEKSSTAIVLPCGIDTIVPYSNRKTAVKALEKGGVIISEYTPGTPALSFRFVQRDRLIAALSCATVVIQSPCGSGALITAKCALDYGREVVFHKAAFEKDSRILEEASRRKWEEMIARGKPFEYKIHCNAEKFLEDGAPVVENFEEFLDCLESEPGKFSVKLRTDEKDEKCLPLFKSLFEK